MTIDIGIKMREQMEVLLVAEGGNDAINDKVLSP